MLIDLAKMAKIHTCMCVFGLANSLLGSPMANPAFLRPKYMIIYSHPIRTMVGVRYKGDVLGSCTFT